MANRLSKIYTRTGDDGSTGLGDGSRVSKNDLRVEAMGNIDELNAVIGLLLTEALSPSINNTLVCIQHDLFDLGGELSIPGHVLLGQHRIAELEQALDSFNANLAPLKEFILPGGSRGAATCHLARTVCRRCERILISLQSEQAISPSALPYINRLSDLLFVLARLINHEAGLPDVLWQHQR